MATLTERSIVDELDRDVARPAKSPDQLIVAEYLQQLRAASQDQALFDAVVLRLDKHRRLGASDVIEVSHRYVANGKGVKPKSGAAAILAIKKRFRELVLDRHKDLSVTRHER